MHTLTNKEQKLLIFIGIIVLIVAAIALFNKQLEQTSLLSKTTNSSAENQSQPSAYIQKAYIQSFNTDGSLEFKVETPKLEQFSKKNIMILDTPTIVYNTTYQYRITAKTGTLFNKQDLLLESNAVIKKTNTQQSMKSQRFNIDLKNKVITSNQHVQLRSAEGVTTANGLHANVTSQAIKLTNRVRGIYEP